MYRFNDGGVWSDCTNVKSLLLVVYESRGLWGAANCSATAWKQTNSRRESGPIPNGGDFSLPHTRLLRRDCGSWSAACYRSHPEFRLAHFPIHFQFFPPQEASAVLQTSTIWTPFASYATTEQPQPQAVPRLLPRWQLPPRPPSLALCALINLSSTKALQNHTLRVFAAKVNKLFTFDDAQELRLWGNFTLYCGLCKHERFNLTLNWVSDYLLSNSKLFPASQCEKHLPFFKNYLIYAPNFVLWPLRMVHIDDY